MKNTKFKPGSSGNPGGRPKALIDVREIARKRTQANLDLLVKWAEQENDPQVAVRAVIALHEIAWGKPGQAVELTSAETGPLIIRWQE